MLIACLSNPLSNSAYIKCQTWQTCICYSHKSGVSTVLCCSWRIFSSTSSYDLQWRCFEIRNTASIITSRLDPLSSGFHRSSELENTFSFTWDDQNFSSNMKSCCNHKNAPRFGDVSSLFVVKLSYFAKARLQIKITHLVETCPKFTWL